jgi:hypothetical protein
MVIKDKDGDIVLSTAYRDGHVFFEDRADCIIFKKRHIPSVIKTLEEYQKKAEQRRNRKNREG